MVRDFYGGCYEKAVMLGKELTIKYLSISRHQKAQ
jgi:hypothetical protein